MSRNAHVHPIMSALIEAYIAPPLGTGPLEVDCPAAVAEETRSHVDVIDANELDSAAGPRIVTHHDPKPVPSRKWDWTAVDDRTYDGEGCPVGYGATEAEAIADLQEQLEDDVAPITDETLHEDRPGRSERERLMDDLGLSEKDFR